MRERNAIESDYRTEGAIYQYLLFFFYIERGSYERLID